MFRLIEVERFEKESNLIFQNTILDNRPQAIIDEEDNTSSVNKEVKHKKERKTTKLQICKEKVRRKANEIWRKDSTITIAGMSVSDEITNITI